MICTSFDESKHKNLDLCFDTEYANCDFLNGFTTENMNVIIYTHNVTFQYGVILEGELNTNTMVLIDNIISYIPINGHYINSLMLCDCNLIKNIHIDSHIMSKYSHNQYPFHI